MRDQRDEPFFKNIEGGEKIKDKGRGGKVLSGSKRGKERRKLKRGGKGEKPNEGLCRLVATS